METVAKKKRSVVKREKRDARKEAAKTGRSVGKLKNVPTSPRKMRLIADLIRGERVNKALNILKYEPKVGFDEGLRRTVEYYKTAKSGK